MKFILDNLHMGLPRHLLLILVSQWMSYLLAKQPYLAAVLKGPANYHPIRKKERAIARRNWVLKRMYVNGYIRADEMLEAQASELVPKISKKERQFTAVLLFY